MWIFIAIMRRLDYKIDNEDKDYSKIVYGPMIYWEKQNSFLYF